MIIYNGSDHKVYLQKSFRVKVQHYVILYPSAVQLMLEFIVGVNTLPCLRNAIPECDTPIKRDFQHRHILSNTLFKFDSIPTSQMYLWPNWIKYLSTFAKSENHNIIVFPP